MSSLRTQLINPCLCLNLKHLILRVAHELLGHHTSTSLVIAAFDVIDVEKINALLWSLPKSSTEIDPSPSVLYKSAIWSFMRSIFSCWQVTFHLQLPSGKGPGQFLFKLNWKSKLQCKLFFLNWDLPGQWKCKSWLSKGQATCRIHVFFQPSAYNL